MKKAKFATTVKGERVEIESGLTGASLKFDSLERVETNYLLRVIAEEERNLDLREKATANRWRRWREKQSPQERARLAATAQNPPPVDILRLVNAREDFKKLGETVKKRKQLHLESQLSMNPDALKIRYDSSLERQFYRAMVMLLKIKEARAKGNGFVSQEIKLAQTIPDPGTGMMDDHAEGDDKENYDVTEDLPIMEVFRKIIRSGVMAEEGREKFARHIVSLPEPGKSQAIEELKKQGLVKVLEEIKKTEDEKAVKTAESPDNLPIRITGMPQSD